ncbi:MAG: Dam family site-specific DNA-(adenine-N6)-methyltransferase [Anaerolineae bacterium]|jgi:DNA adenine methylase|nr:Dam family site-specific DNA-(adenine-N6)-methyltransferase [Anaerolineae bacterium]
MPSFRAKPFLKWAGGKRQLLKQIHLHLPDELLQGKIKRYIEPFLGGGAVFLDLIQSHSIEEVYLFDINQELILAYKTIQREPTQLINFLTKLKDEYYSKSDEGRKDYFYAIRETYNKQRHIIDPYSFSENWIGRTAYMIFLNKTCYNGLYRVNSSGGFNVPFGRYKKPKIVDAENLLAVSKLLTDVEIYAGEYQYCETFVNNNSFVYFDPPYRPISTTSSFTSYSKDKFSEQNQIELAEFFSRLNRKTDAKLMLSNSDPKNVDPTDTFFETHYSTHNIDKVFATRMINSKAAGRGKITELLITNYSRENDDKK